VKHPHPSPARPTHTGALFYDPDEAVACVQRLYDEQINLLRRQWRAFAEGTLTRDPVMACYPFVRLVVSEPPRIDPLAAYGFVGEPGTYSATLTRPDLFERYLKEQFRLLRQHHDAPLEVGLSSSIIPIPFAQPEDGTVEATIPPERRDAFRRLFLAPSARRHVDDTLADEAWGPQADGTLPLSLFSAQRVDLSLHRLRHYTGTTAGWFQGFVIFTNYDFYMQEFRRIALEEICAATHDPDARAYRSQYNAFVEPGDRITHNANLNPGPDGAGRIEGETATRTPQMPAYHLVRADGLGITMVNIGVGPSNAKTITDHIAALRPHAWIMAGHCGGLSLTQQLGDYVLAHAYLREDKVLDPFLPTAIPVPALAEVQQALMTASSRITGLTGDALRRVVRTGTVVSTGDRNWELNQRDVLVKRFNASRAIAIDMESATIAANGYRFGVPYGTLLCVSDKPMHGEPKLPGMASAFYDQRKEQHTRIAIQAMELLRDQFGQTVFSRKLMRFVPVPFR